MSTVIPLPPQLSLLTAAAESPPEIITLLLEQSKDSLHYLSPTGENILMLSVDNYHQKTFEVILPYFHSNPTFLKHIDSAGDNIVHKILRRYWGGQKRKRLELICQSLDPEILHEILNARNKADETPAFVAVKSGHLDILTFIVWQGSNLNYPLHNAEKYPLVYAVKSGEGEQNLNIVEKLLSLGANPHQKDSGGNNLLMIAAIQFKLKLFSLFNKMGLDINARNLKGDTALLSAARKGDYYAVRLLIENGASILVRDSEGNSPLALALNSSLKDNTTLMHLLNPETQDQAFQEVTDIENKKRLLQAIRQQDIYYIRYLSYIDSEIFRENIEGLTVIAHAVQSGNLDIVKLVMGITRQYLCCNSCNNCEDCEQCNDHSPNLGDKKGYISLHHAVTLGSLPIVQYLVEHQAGIECEAEESNNITPLKLAQKLGRIEIEEYLTKTKIEQDRNAALDSLSIPPGPLNMECFIEEIEGVNTVAAKAFPLLAHHNFLKHGINTLFVAIDKAALVHALKQLDAATNGTDFTLIFKFQPDDHADMTDMHMVAIKCEKYLNQNHIIFLDSVAGYTHYLQDFIEEDCKEMLAYTHLYHCETRRQTDCFSCGIFSTKDAFKFSRTKKFTEELQKGHYVTNTKKINSGLTVHTFKIPSRFMHLSQSPDTLGDFLEKDPVEKFLNIYHGTQGKLLSFSEYTHKPRKCEDIEVASLSIKNRHFISHEKTPEIPEYIQKSQVAIYFRKKYLEKILPYMLKKYSEAELIEIIEKYDAANLCLTPDRAIVSKVDLNKSSELEHIEKQKILQQSQQCQCESSMLQFPDQTRFLDLIMFSPDKEESHKSLLCPLFSFTYSPNTVMDESEDSVSEDYPSQVAEETLNDDQPEGDQPEGDKQDSDDEGSVASNESDTPQTQEQSPKAIKNLDSDNSDVIMETASENSNMLDLAFLQSSSELPAPLIFSTTTNAGNGSNGNGTKRKINPVDEAQYFTQVMSSEENIAIIDAFKKPSKRPKIKQS